MPFVAVATRRSTFESCVDQRCVREMRIDQCAIGGAVDSGKLWLCGHHSSDCSITKWISHYCYLLCTGSVFRPN
jgi:hypothetical protein